MIVLTLVNSSSAVVLEPPIRSARATPYKCDPPFDVNGTLINDIARCNVSSWPCKLDTAEFGLGVVTRVGASKISLSFKEGNASLLRKSGRRPSVVDRFESIDGLCASEVFPVSKVFGTGGLISNEKLIPLETLLRATCLDWSRHKGDFNFVNSVISKEKSSRLDYINKVLVGRLNEEGWRSRLMIRIFQSGDEELTISCDIVSEIYVNPGLSLKDLSVR